ncbi:tyrosine-type recombinase/integrase [Gordonia sp. MP11Mi]|uniref:Tyrosine recombinase XerC n=1 Tax=Gordonia sp. MP11Mi TaxID=3022769 RepID=A0AA97GTT1_9ACTN
MTSTTWHRTVNRFTEHLRAQRLSDHTIGYHASHVRRAADALAVDPGDVTPARLARYLDGRTWTAATYRNNVKSLRVFFAWYVAMTGALVNPAADIPLNAPDPAAMTARAMTYPDRSRTGPDPKAVPTQWAHWIDEWDTFARAQGRPKTTRETRRYQLSAFARAMHPTGPAEVTEIDVTDWFAAGDWRTETRRSHRTTLRGFFSWTVTTGRRTDNPATHLPPPPVAPTSPRPAAEADYRFALRIADPRDRLMVRLAAECGLRRAEVAAMHSRDVLDVPGGRHMLTVTGKGGRRRMVPCPPDLARDVRRAGGYVFPSTASSTGHLTPAYVGKRTARLLPADVTMHQLRHRFATRVYASSRDLFALQQTLGHASPETTRRYVALDTDSLFTAAHAAW